MGVTVCTLQVEAATGVSVHGMKVYGGVEVWLHLFVTRKLAVDKWSASLPGQRNSGKSAVGTNCRRKQWFGSTVALVD